MVETLSLSCIWEDLTTAGRYSEGIDLTYILFDNESNKSTGGQNTYQNHVDYKAIAKDRVLK